MLGDLGTARSAFHPAPRDQHRTTVPSLRVLHDPTLGQHEAEGLRVFQRLGPGGAARAGSVSHVQAEVEDADRVGEGADGEVVDAGAGVVGGLIE
ncbi:hypothetical protein NN3_59530 [Nocardia neocaledoniensis NBRC 108232]|nr:hypothetical protein NN3_59530 [Nocardia neocaledoniensis NBRC 108232]